MNTFLERLKVEKIELDERIEKLTAFSNSDKFKDIDSKQQSLLNVQLKIMESYSQILLERLVLLNT
jgi:uncharacterized membrane protein (DUF106 family)